MTKPQTLIEQIEQILSHPDLIRQQRERVADQAHRYASMCDRVNERLALCFAQISCGNNAEAVRISNDLNILSDYNILYGSVFEPWHTLALRESLEVPPVPAENMARNLMKAYESDVLTKDLQDRFRFQSLSLAPIRDRLWTLYQLEQREPQNLIWSEMIPEFEQVRFEEMKAEFRKLPLETSSMTALSALRRELEVTVWISPVPENLSGPLNQAIASLSRQTAIEKLASLSEKVQDAWSEQDIEKTRGFLSIWNDQVSRNNIKTSEIIPEALNTVRQASAWLEEISRQDELEQNFEDRTDEMRALLRNSDDVNELIAAHSSLALAADSGNFVIPPALEDSYRTKVRSIDLQKTRRMRAIIAGTLVVAALVGSILFLGIRQLAITASRRSEAEMLRRYLDDFEGLGTSGVRDDAALDKASKQLEALREQSPGIYDSTPIREQLARFQILFDGEQQRVADINSLRSRIEEKFSSNQAVDYELGRLETLVRSDAERIDLTNMKKRQTEIARGIRKDRDSIFKTKLDAIIATHTTLQNEKNISSQAVLQSLRKIERDLASLETIQQGVSTTYIQMAAALKNKVDSQYDSLTREETLSRDYQSLSELVGKETEWKTALETIAKDHETDDEGNDARTAIKAISNLNVIERWNTFITSRAATVNEWENDPVLGREIIAEAEPADGIEIIIPEYASFQEYVDKIKPFIESGGRSKLIQDLVAALKNYNRTYWLLYRSGNDKYYYYQQRPESRLQKITCDLGECETNSVTLNDSEIQQVVEAPHYLVVSRALLALGPLSNKLTTEQWIQVCDELLSGLDPNKEDATFDPVVKTILLEKVLEVLVQDPLFSPVFQDWNDEIRNNEEFDPFVNFFQPRDEALGRQRQIAKSLLKALVAGQSLTNKLADVKSNRTTHVDFNVTYRWVGFINSEGGRFVCSPGSEKVPDGTLWAVGIGEGSGLAEIGKCEGGVMECTVPFGDFVRGLPVFLKETR